MSTKTNETPEVVEDETALTVPQTVADLEAEVKREVIEEVSQVQRRKLKQMLKEIAGMESLLAQRKRQLEEFKAQPLVLPEGDDIIFEIEGA